MTEGLGLDVQFVMFYKYFTVTPIFERILLDPVPLENSMT